MMKVGVFNNVRGALLRRFGGTESAGIFHVLPERYAPAILPVAHMFLTVLSDTPQRFAISATETKFMAHPTQTSLQQSIGNKTNY